ncbi:hypothetical protein NUSPORA_01856 [Nucleospora cyclopteri]
MLNSPYVKYIKIYYLFFVLKIVMISIVAYKVEFQNTVNRARFYGITFLTCLLDIFDFYLIVDVFINKNLFEFLMYNCLVLYQLIIAVYFLVLLWLTKNQEFVAKLFQLLTSVTILIESIYTFLLYRLMKSEFVKNTFKLIGANPTQLAAFKYKEQLKVLGKLQILYLLLSFTFSSLIGFTDFTAENILAILKLVNRFFVIIPIYFAPEEEERWIKYIQLGASTISILISLVIIPLSLANVLLNENFK